MALEAYFKKFRDNIIGIDQTIATADEMERPILYADWVASGRCYRPIEERLMKEIMPFVANTHTETSSTGMAMTAAYTKARAIIKEHVHADADDVLIAANSGMTGVLNKFQRILGLRVHERYASCLPLTDRERPVVFITHMEHHSNHTSWLETIGHVEIVPPDSEGLVSLENFKNIVTKYADHPYKIAAITACSNVTGIKVPYFEIARLMHEAGGYCFVDFACSAPYVAIDMHPEDHRACLDAVSFSPHKFLGGPGTTGVLVFNRRLYKNKIPDNPGGGTVDWTNPWGEHKFIDSIEEREDGGTPAFLQTMKVALCINLKNQMGIDAIRTREEEQMKRLWSALDSVDSLHILAPRHRDRLGVISFYIDGLHYNLGVKMLNDRFGIQSRGGCSCAGTYGHYLLNVGQETSHKITNLINKGDFSLKPGWIRVSIHPTMTDDEIDRLGRGIRELAKNHRAWVDAYHVDARSHTVSAKDAASDDGLRKRMAAVLTREFG